MAGAHRYPQEGLGMENELSLSNADLGMNVLNVLAELDKRIQEKNSEINTLSIGWSGDKNDNRLARLKQELEKLEERREIIKAGQSWGGAGSVFTTMILGFACRIKKSQKNLEDQKREEEDCEYQLLEIEEDMGNVAKERDALKKEMLNIYANNKITPPDLAQRREEIRTKLHNLKIEGESFQKNEEASNNAILGYGRRISDDLEHAKKIIEIDKEASNALPDYEKMAQAAKHLEEAAFQLKQHEEDKEAVIDFWENKDEDKKLLAYIDATIKTSLANLSEALKEERVAFKGKDPHYEAVNNKVSDLEEAIKNLGTDPDHISKENCIQIINAAQGLQKLPDDFKDLRIEREIQENKILSLIRETEANINLATIQEAIQGLIEFAKQFRKLEEEADCK